MAKRGKLNPKAFQDEKSRPIRWRKYNYLFLIVCEDEKTEPYYFSSFKAKFPANTLYLKTVGAGKSALGVVQQAILESEELGFKSSRTVDEVWVVFDTDDARQVPANLKRFEDAFILAQDTGIQLAWSNEVFELWLLLHFETVDPTIWIPRQEIYHRLEKSIQNLPKFEVFRYQHGNSDIVDIVLEFGSMSDAIDRAKVLAKHFASTKPIDANPCSHVFQLAEQINSWIDYFNYQP